MGGSPGRDSRRQLCARGELLWRPAGSALFPLTCGSRRCGNWRSKPPITGCSRLSWLSVRQAQTLLNAPGATTTKGVRDRAILAVLLGCGLRRSEVAALTVGHVQQRDGRWCIVDLVGKHGRVRTIPMPTWVKVATDAWTSAAGVADGYVFRPVNRAGKVQGIGMSEKVVWQLLQPYAAAAGVPGIAPHDCRRTCAKLCRASGGELEQIQLLLGHASVQTTERYLGTKQDLVHAPNDGIKLSRGVDPANKNAEDAGCGVGGGEKGYQNGGEAVPCQGSRSELAFPSSQKRCPEPPAGAKGAPLLGAA